MGMSTELQRDTHFATYSEEFMQRLVRSVLAKR
jgi:hypothetical protein